MFRRGLRSSFAMFSPSLARYWMNISCPSVSCAGRAYRRERGSELTVASVMTNAALLEQSLMSWSCAMIFFTLDTVGV